MKKNAKKVLINTLKILVIIIFMIFLFKSTIVNAEITANPIDNPDIYKLTGEDANTDDVMNIIGKIITIVNIIGAIISVGAIAVIGIKYILGSVEERAEYKKVMTPYLIGAFFVFASTTVVNIVYNIGIKLFN